MRQIKEGDNMWYKILLKLMKHENNYLLFKWILEEYDNYVYIKCTVKSFKMLKGSLHFIVFDKFLK